MLAKGQNNSTVFCEGTPRTASMPFQKKLDINCLAGSYKLFMYFFIFLFLELCVAEQVSLHLGQFSEGLFGGFSSPCFYLYFQELRK